MASDPQIARRDEDDILGALRDTLEPGEDAVVVSERRLSVVADEQGPERRMRDVLGGMEPWEAIAELGKRSPGGRQGLHCSTGRRRKRR